MNSIMVHGGTKGMRVIVDGKNEESTTVDAGDETSFEFNGKIEVRALGMDADLAGFSASNNTGGTDGNAG